jgi:hypothetical protein
LKVYRLDNGTYPSTEEGLNALIRKPADQKQAENWNGPYLKSLPRDPWNNQYAYEFPGTRGGNGATPDIWSRGPDGKENTDDDIGNWERDAQAIADPADAARAHFRAVLELDGETLKETYASNIQLMPGHEFLKDGYGLTEPGGRARGARIERQKLIDVMLRRPVDPAEAAVIEKMLPTLKFEKLAVAAGEFVIVTDPTDPIQFPDGKLHFTIVKGDVLIKIAPPRGDFVLLQMREADGKWQVIAEYLD